ncbi:MAG: histidine--tRNA ligase [Promethearchaeota archaeon]
MVNDQTEKKKLNLQKPSGTVDYLPEIMDKRRWLTRTVEDLFQKYGYQQIMIPIYDFFELYKIRSGEKIINDIFTFYDPPKHRAAENPALYALRPEFTAPLVRAFNSTELMYRPRPQKYFYIGPCFRYDEPAPGRYRQFTQIGIEIYGADTAVADAEMLIVAMDLMKNLKIDDYLLRINDLTFLRTYLQEHQFSMEIQNGIFGIIDRITSLLRKLEIGALEDTTVDDLVANYYEDMDALQIDREITEQLENFLHLVGTPEEVEAKLKEIFSNNPQTVEAIENSRINEVSKLIEAAGITNYVMDCGIARGLDYYTNVVFEIDVPALGKEKQVCGGGRYNSMIREFGGDDCPALGFSFGFERLIIAMEKQNEIASNPYRADLFIGTKAETREYGMSIAQKLRNSGCRVEVDLMNRSFKSAAKFVNRMKIPFMLFLGPREQESGKFTLKEFKTQEQFRDISLDDVIKKILG